MGEVRGTGSARPVSQHPPHRDEPTPEVGEGRGKGEKAHKKRAIAEEPSKATLRYLVRWVVVDRYLISFVQVIRLW